MLLLLHVAIDAHPLYCCIYTVLVSWHFLLNIVASAKKGHLRLGRGSDRPSLVSKQARFLFLAARSSYKATWLFVDALLSVNCPSLFFPYS